MSNKTAEPSSAIHLPTPTIQRPMAATAVKTRTGSMYPTKELRQVAIGREKRALGDAFGLQNFGVNYTTLAPGGSSSSSLQHCHARQDEFIYILQGQAVLHYGDEEIAMKAGDCMGFPAGQEIPHCIVNASSSSSLVFLEIGDRTPGDHVTYAHADLQAVHQDGRWKFLHKDGAPYQEEGEGEEE